MVLPLASPWQLIQIFLGKIFLTERVTIKLTKCKCKTDGAVALRHTQEAIIAPRNAVQWVADNVTLNIGTRGLVSGGQFI